MSNVPTQVSAVTRCPHCSAKFRVRPEQVKLHAGLVRCGACRGIFDAVEHLIEGILPPMPPMHEADEGASPQTIVQGMPAMTAERDEASVKVANVDDVNVTNDVAVSVRTTNGVSPESADPLVRNLDADTPSATGTATATDKTTHDLNDYRWRAPAQVESRGARWGYAVAAFIAVLMLLGQGAYYFRDELVSRVPQSAPYVAMACEQIGCRVEPPKRVESLGFVGADLAADPAHKGLLIFTTILRNTGTRTVAFPHLVLSLDGLGGELIVRRVFTPTEFAPATANLAHGLDGGAEVEIKLYLDASQVNVVGFKVDHAYL
ncbi:MAG: zinc-ribbon and DUF3426 domain-containing protein [Casimicrobium sp.]